jgi:hypothetical protein
MDIGPVKRVGPDFTLDTTWGTYPTPYFNVPSATNSRIVNYLPPTIRGRHLYRNQPRAVSQMPLDPRVVGQRDMALRHAPSMVPGDLIAHAVGAVENHQAETKMGLYLFLGALGLAIVAFGGKK